MTRGELTFSLKSFCETGAPYPYDVDIGENSVHAHFEPAQSG